MPVGGHGECIRGHDTLDYYGMVGKWKLRRSVE